MTGLNNQSPPCLYSIQALRGIGAFLILLQHIPFINTGSFGVDLFFCISGFMAMYSTREETPHFLTKRLLRIFPLYSLITLLLYFVTILFPSLFESTKESFPQLLKSLCFIPFEISPTIVQPILRVGWTLNYEVLFYVLFALSMSFHHRNRGLICSGILVGLTFMGLLARIANPAFPKPFSFWTEPIILEFALGILGYYVYCCLLDHGDLKNSNSLKKHPFPAISTLELEHVPGIGLLALSLLSSMLLLQNKLNLLGMGRPLLLGIPSLLVFLFFLQLESWFTKPNLQPYLQPLIQLGNISYSFYLLHYPILMFVDRKIYSLQELNIYSFFVVMGATLWILLLSYFSYEYLEPTSKTFYQLYIQFIKKKYN